MSTIIARIDEARASWVMKVGEYPTRMFLGEREHKHLTELAAKFCGIRDPDFQLPRRMKYANMEVFRVDAETFIDFGWDGPPPSPAG